MSGAGAAPRLGLELQPNGGGTLRRTRIRLITLVSAIALAVSAAGCSSDDEEADKAGGSGSTAMLRVGTPDREGSPGGTALEEFSRRVDQLSDGTVRVKIVFEAFEGENPTRWDQSVAERVRGGELDMGLVPARAFDALGVTSLRALQAPFLIDSDALLGEVVADEPLADEMLAGLGEAGLTGISLWPEGLRHPFGFERAFRALADFEGSKVRAPYSQASYELLRTLGAKPVDLAGKQLTTGIASGEVTGAESSFALASTTLPKAGVATSNIVFFPKVNALVINGDALDDLSDDQAAALREAAADTQQSTIENVQDADAARRYCQEQGGAVVAAREADLDEIVDAASPVYDQLESESPTKELISRIRALRADLDGGDTASPCGPPSPGATQGETTAEERGEPAIADGVYRTTFTADEFLDAGVSSQFAHENAGLWSLTFRDGSFTYGGIDEDGNPVSECKGESSAAGKRIAIAWSPETECSGDITAKLTIDAEGNLRFGDVKSAALLDRVLWSIHEWEKIG